MLMSPNNMIVSLLLNTPFKIHLPVTIIITAIVYAFNYLFTVFCFFPNKWQKMNTVSQTESRTLLQHHSFKNSITLRSPYDKGSAEQTSKTLFSTRVCNTSTAAAALQCYFILFF